MLQKCSDTVHYPEQSLSSYVGTRKHTNLFIRRCCIKPSMDRYRSISLFGGSEVGRERSLPLEEEHRADSHSYKTDCFAYIERKTYSFDIRSERGVADEAHAEGSHEHRRNHRDKIGLAETSKINAAGPEREDR